MENLLLTKLAQQAETHWNFDPHKVRPAEDPASFPQLLDSIEIWCHNSWLLTLSIEPSLWAQRGLSQSADETTKHEYDDKGRSSPECKCY